MSEETKRAIELRDLALAVVKARGAWQATRGGPNLLYYRDDALNIAYRSPFQKPPPLSREVVRLAMNYGMMPEINLPHGLDIWQKGKPGKVLNIEWSDNGAVIVVSYKSGPWEQALHKLVNS
jgi:hypothetical protein